MLENLGDAKVDDHDAAIRFPHHKVARLDVAEDDWRLVAVQISQDIAYLEGPLYDLLLSKCTPIRFEEILQGLTFDELEDEVAALAFGEKVKDLGMDGWDRLARMLASRSKL